MKDMSVCVGAAGSGAKPRRPGLEKRRRRRESGKPRRPGLAAARRVGDTEGVLEIRVGYSNSGRDTAAF